MDLDIKIQNCQIVDGRGGAPYEGDVGIVKDRIEFVGDLKNFQARRILDGIGKTLTPGFINPHSHDDFYVVRKDRARFFEPTLRQGVTTAVMGNCERESSTI